MSFLYPTTREQKEYVALCDYYFNVLTPLADPKSRIHWIEYFMALDHESIPAHALHAATLHGDYVLQSGPRQHLHTDLVLQNISSPYPRVVLNLQDSSILTPTESGWRPQNYDSLHEQVLSRPAWKDNANKPLCRELSPRLEKQQAEVFLVLAQLETKIKEVNERLACSETLAKKCEVVNTTHGVKFSPVEGGSLKVNDDCSICYCTLRVDLAAEIGLLALKLKNKKRDVKKIPTARERALAMKRRVTQVLISQERPLAKTEFERLREAIVRDVQGMTIREDLVDRLTADVLEFEESFKTSRASIKELEGSRCVDSVVFKCGHVLGLKCISLWLDKAKTCPCCRGGLAKPVPQEQTYQIPLIPAAVEPDHDMEAEAEEVEEDEHFISALNNINAFTCDGILRDGLEGDYESDVEPCDLDE